MAEVKWTPQAADDLEGITQFIAADSPYYASLFAMDVLAAVERLTVFPIPVESFRKSTTLQFGRLSSAAIGLCTG